MTFKHDWCDEVITQFSTSLWVEEGNVRKEERFHFLVEGEKYHCSYIRFAKILGFIEKD